MESAIRAIIYRQTHGIGPQHPTQVVAQALTLMGGGAWHSLCCWCLEKASVEDRRCFRVRVGYGECDRCAYAGRDCLVVEDT